MVLELEKPKSDSIWDDYVPIIKDGDKYTVYLTEQIDMPANYNKLIHLLNNAKSHEIVDLVINNGGGIIDSGFMIINAIHTSDAFVTAKLSGTVASVATIIALACDTLIAEPNLSFMIHNYSASIGHQKGHELKAYQNFTDKELNKTFREVYKDFLTEEEMTDVIDGKDIWLNTEEVQTRWTNKEAQQ